MRIVVWQYMHVMHQSAMLKALAEMGHEVVSVAEIEMTKQQRSMGYFLPQMKNLKVVTAPNDSEIVSLIEERKNESVHIIGGTRGYQLGKKVMKTCKRFNARVGLLVEGADPSGLAGFLRRIIYIGQKIQYINSVDFILAMGMNGVNWYLSCGWPSSCLFPYAYITESPKIESPKPIINENDRVEIVYLGQLIHRKGVDTLIKAIAKLSINNWHLTFIGDGPEYQQYKNLINSLRIEDNCSFLGVVANQEVMKVISRSDLLVLPSRFDGWGATTNEALMCGIPVICSDRCGSRDLLRENWRGNIFKHESVEDLENVLSIWISKGKKKPALSEEIKEWSKRIEGKSAANYVCSIIDHVYNNGLLPTPPWYT